MGHLLGWQDTRSSFVARRELSVIVLAVMALIQAAVLGCSAESTSRTSPPPTTEPHEPDEPDAEPTCHDGDACQCEDGRQGLTICQQTSSVCDCESCPQVTVTEAPEFDACAGEPFGVWESDSITAPSLTLRLYQRDRLGGVNFAGTCPTQVDELVTRGKVRLSLLDGGDAVMTGSPVSLSYRLLDECVQETVDQSCTQLELNGKCTKTCGICQCDLMGNTFDGEGTWSRQGSTLTLSLANVWSLDYCVQGDRLMLRDIDGLVLELHRLNLFSSPAACAGRSPEACVRGCALGACEGGVLCEAAMNEASCTNRQGCTWNAESCVGQPEPCELADYGVVPGCDLTDTPLNCTGTRAPCRDMDSVSCEAAPGCMVSAGCEGGAVSCGKLTGACSFCGDVDGCGDCGEGSASCAGSSSCVAQQSSYACERVKQLGMGDCQWVEGLCMGEPTPCDELPPEACASAPGCELQESQ